MTPQLAAYFEFEPEASGVVVTRVDPGSPASRQGVHAGMIVQQVEDVPVRTLADLELAIQSPSKGEGLLLRVWDGEFSSFLILR